MNGGRPAGYRPLAPAEFDDLLAVSDARAVAAVAVDVGAIALAAGVCSLHFSLPLYLLTVVVIGARQQGLLVLMHEASHGRLLSRPRVNDWIGEAALAWPLFFSMLAYRENHIAHHDHLNTEDDPDWRRYRAADARERDDWTCPRPPARVLLPLARDLLGLHALGQLRRMRRLLVPGDHRRGADRATGGRAAVVMPRAWRAARGAAYGAAALVLAASGGWWPLLLYWIVPALTMLTMCIRLRRLAGHFAVYGGDGLRTTLCGPLERFLLAPHNIGFHTEHHLYPAVAWHRLPDLHARLRARGDFAGDHPFRLTRGHRGVIRDWSQAPAVTGART